MQREILGQLWKDCMLQCDTSVFQKWNFIFLTGEGGCVQGKTERLLFLHCWEGRGFSGTVLFPGSLLVQLGFLGVEPSLDFLSVWFCGGECMWEWVWVFVGEVLNGFCLVLFSEGLFCLSVVVFSPSCWSPFILFAVLYSTWWACRSCVRYCLGTLLCKLFLTESNVSQVHFFTFNFVSSYFP